MIPAVGIQGGIIVKMAGKISAFFGTQDLTKGNPLTGLIQFSVPLLIGNLAQQLYNTVDSIVVGKYVGDTALAAVGASGPILNLLLVLFMGIAIGATVMVAQYFGAQQKDLLSKTVGNTITLTVLSSLIIMAVGPLLTGPLLSLLNTPPDIYGLSWTYLMIIFLGIMGAASYNILSGVLRGLGDSFWPLVYLVIACLLNIVLDLLFVAVFHWSVAGVAIATVIAQFVSGILCLLRLIHMKEIVVVTKSSLRLQRDLVMKLIRLGLPAGLSQAIFSLAAIVVQSLTNSFGTAIIASSIVVMRVDGFAMMPNFTFGTAMTTYTGQNVGARQMDRVHQGTKDGVIIGLVTSSLLTVLILVFGRPLMGLFTNTPEVVSMSFHFMCILAAGYIAMSITQVLSGVMRGAGDTMTPMWISIITTVIIRVPIAYGIAFYTASNRAELGTGNPDSLFISLLISWVLGAVITWAFYLKGKWREKALSPAQ